MSVSSSLPLPGSRFVKRPCKQESPTTRTYKLEISLDAFQNQAHALRRHQLSPLPLMRRVNVDSEIRGPVDARRLGVADIRHIVDMLLFANTHTHTQSVFVRAPLLRSEHARTYKTIHLPPDDLLPLQPAPAARQEPLAARDQPAPLGRQRAQDGAGFGDLRGRAAEDEAFAYAGAEVAEPMRWGRVRCWRGGGRREGTGERGWCWCRCCDPASAEEDEGRSKRHCGRGTGEIRRRGQKGSDLPRTPSHNEKLQ